MSVTASVPYRRCRLTLRDQAGRCKIEQERGWADVCSILQTKAVVHCATVCRHDISVWDVYR